MSKRSLAVLIPVSIAAIVIIFAGWFKQAQVQQAAQPNPSTIGEVLIGGPFTLTNQQGKPVSDTDFQGKLMLVYFGFSHCPMICPTDMATLTRAMDQLGADAAQVQPVFITIDPERDTVEKLAEFAKAFYPGFQLLTGTPEQVKVATDAYRVYAQKVEMDGGDYMMDHSAYIYLMGRDGKYLTHFQHDQPAEEIVAEVKEFMQK